MSGVARTALLGASSLQGKELLERLGESRSRLGRVMLAESGAEEAVAAPVDGEWLVSTPLMDEALEGAELILCCALLSGEAREAVLRLGGEAIVVDLAGSLGGRAFDVRRGLSLQRLGRGIHASPKGASLLVSALSRAALAAGAPSPLRAVACEPASEIGRPAIDELHAQALALLRFEPLPQAVFGRQAVHDVVSPGPGGAEAEARIRREVRDLAGADVSVLVLRPGLFHGVGVALHAGVGAEGWRKALLDEPRVDVDLEDDAASPASSVTSERAIVGRLVEDGFGGTWAWAAADTLAQGAVGNVVDLIAAS